MEPNWDDSPANISSLDTSNIPSTPKVYNRPKVVPFDIFAEDRNMETLDATSPRSRNVLPVQSLPSGLSFQGPMVDKGRTGVDLDEGIDSIQLPGTIADVNVQRQQDRAAGMVLQSMPLQERRYTSKELASDSSSKQGLGGSTDRSWSKNGASYWEDHTMTTPKAVLSGGTSSLASPHVVDDGSSLTQALAAFSKTANVVPDPLMQHQQALVSSSIPLERWSQKAVPGDFSQLEASVDIQDQPSRATSTLKAALGGGTFSRPLSATSIARSSRPGSAAGRPPKLPLSRPGSAGSVRRREGDGPVDLPSSEFAEVKRTLQMSPLPPLRAL